MVVLQSRSTVKVYGSIITDSLGPLGGPGSPTNSNTGLGATYGGSGGCVNCHNTTFSNTITQVRIRYKG